MKVSEKIKKYQDGGAAPAGGDPSQGGAPSGAPAGGDPSQGQGGPDASQGQDPVSQLLQLAQQALQGQDCQAAMAVCDGLISLVQQSQGQGGAGAPGGAPGGSPDQGGAPAGGPGVPSQRAGGRIGKPVFKAGGALVRRIY